MEARSEYIQPSKRDTLFAVAELLRKVEKLAEFEAIKNEVSRAETALYDILNELHEAEFNPCYNVVLPSQ